MPTTFVELRSSAEPYRSEDYTPAAPASGRPLDDGRDLLMHDIRSPLAAIRGYAQLLRRRTATSQLNIVALMETLEHIEAAREPCSRPTRRARRPSDDRSRPDGYVPSAAD